LQSYVALNEQYPDTAAVLLRLGMLRTLRGEYDQAEPRLRRALWLEIEGQSYEITLLYLSYLLRQKGMATEAQQAWDRAGLSPTLAGPALVLDAEYALSQGDTQAAQTRYHKAIQEPLPSDWLPLVGYRLALFQAANEPDRALAALIAFSTRYARWEQNGFPPSSDQFTAITAPVPLISPLIPRVTQDAEQLIAILEADTNERLQLLGQWYLQLGLYDLAAPQFASIPHDAPEWWLAAGYTAYTRWRAGEREAGIQQLETLVRDQPDVPQMRLLLVLVYLAEQRIDAAALQLDTLEDRYPDMPDVYLSRAMWYVVQSDYANAMSSYEEAMAVAEPNRKGAMAFRAATFSFETTYNICDSGLPMAEYAVLRMVEDAQAWTTLAAMRYHCRDFPGAEHAAHNALERGGGAEASYYLGAALLDMREYEQARRILIQAADSDPDSRWRELAEEQLNMLQ
jgi:tetratricopeptide (TPR) repeat protein